MLRTFAKTYLLNDKIVVDIPLISDFHFPRGTPNEMFLEQNSYKVTNPELLPTENNTELIVYGIADFITNHETYKTERIFTIDKSQYPIMSVQEYRDSHY